MNAADGSLLDLSVEEELVLASGSRLEVVSYARKASLKRHLKTHGDGCLKCSVCTQFYKTDEDKRKHIEEKPVTCESCGKIFSSRNYIALKTTRGMA
ncbi:hypothetical protein DPMN_058832 [Dreissena polymorpha]|uniref:C2H2-type domain-containing protein n=1 Tax=Dreissena polymorpha TaxID=45954 RepID=A0A9D4C2X4_DREPO|nr:hypothetical protein DPMN_058832 [Dreissena polymorpha]